MRPLFFDNDMWKANKTAIVALLLGLLLLGAAHAYLLTVDELLARKVLSAGVCLLLLVVGCFSWFGARKGN